MLCSACRGGETLLWHSTLPFIWPQTELGRAPWGPAVLLGQREGSSLNSAKRARMHSLMLASDLISEISCGVLFLEKLVENPPAPFSVTAQGGLRAVTMKSKPGLAGQGNNMTSWAFCSLLLCLALNRIIKPVPLFDMSYYTFRNAPRCHLPSWRCGKL